MITDGLSYVKMGLAIGRLNPLLAHSLVKMNTLEEMRRLINKELGTDIVRGDSVLGVFQSIELALLVAEEQEKIDIEVL